MSLYVCTTVGCTRYLDEWLNAVSNLKPSIIAVARDTLRSEPLKQHQNLHVLEYTTKPWQSYEERHLNFESDHSILLGIIKLIEHFLSRNETHFLHIDSDVIINKSASLTIYPLTWDYLQFTTPVVPRENPQPTRVMLFWESTNFGISKPIAQKILSELYKLLDKPYPVDINIHKTIRKVNPRKHRLINSGVSHYIKGMKYTI